MDVIVITFDMPSSARRDLSRLRSPGGSAIEPVATIVQRLEEEYVRASARFRALAGEAK